MNLEPMAMSLVQWIIDNPGTSWHDANSLQELVIVEANYRY